MFDKRMIAKFFKEHLNKVKVVIDQVRENLGRRSWYRYLRPTIGFLLGVIKKITFFTQSKESVQLARLLYLCINIGASFYIANAGYENILLLKNRAETDKHSNYIALREGRDFAEGRHKYGIMGTTHYPNGPIYLIAAAYKLGVRDPLKFQKIVAVLSSISLGIFAFTLFSISINWVYWIWGFFVAYTLTLQEGFLLWATHLHEHAHNFNILLLIPALYLLPKRQRIWVPGLLGFISGWVGFDFIPAKNMVVFAMAYLALRRAKHKFLPALRISFLHALVFSSGVFLAVFLHLWQNALYFDSWKTAYADLIGAAAVRAHVDSSLANPVYKKAIDDYAYSSEEIAGIPTQRWPLSQLVVKYFMGQHSFSFVESQYFFEKFFFYMLYGFLAYLFIRYRSSSLPMYGQLILDIFVAGVSILIAIHSWAILMPFHASIHLHFVPRHTFAGVLIAALIPFVCFRDSSGKIWSLSLNREKSRIWLIISALVTYGWFMKHEKYFKENAILPAQTVERLKKPQLKEWIPSYDPR